MNQLISGIWDKLPNNQTQETAPTLKEGTARKFLDDLCGKFYREHGSRVFGCRVISASITLVRSNLYIDKELEIGLRLLLNTPLEDFSELDVLNLALNLANFINQNGRVIYESQPGDENI